MPRRRLIAGENLNRSISAGTWNDLLSLLDHRDRNGLWAPSANQNGEFERNQKATQIWVRNKTGSHLDQFSIVAIDVPAVDETAAYGEFQREVLPEVIVPTATSEGRFAVTVDPIPIDQCGKAIVSGVVQCKVNIDYAVEQFAECIVGDVSALQAGVVGSAQILWQAADTGDATWCIVRIGRKDDLPFRKARSTSTITANGSGTADLYYDGSVYKSVTVYYNWMTGGGNIGTTTDLFVQWFPDEKKWIVVGAECGA